MTKSDCAQSRFLSLDDLRATLIRVLADIGIAAPDFAADAYWVLSGSGAETFNVALIAHGGRTPKDTAEIEWQGGVGGASNVRPRGGVRVSRLAETDAGWQRASGGLAARASEIRELLADGYASAVERLSGQCKAALVESVSAPALLLGRGLELLASNAAADGLLPRLGHLKLSGSGQVLIASGDSGQSMREALQAVLEGLPTASQWRRARRPASRWWSG